MAEAAPGEQRSHNTVAALAPDRELLGTYRKVHLFDAFGYAESDTLIPARIASPLIFDLGELRFDMMICYKPRFPEIARVLVDAGPPRSRCRRRGRSARQRRTTGPPWSGRVPSRTPATCSPPGRPGPVGWRSRGLRGGASRVRAGHDRRRPRQPATQGQPVAGEPPVPGRLGLSLVVPRTGGGPARRADPFPVFVQTSPAVRHTRVAEPVRPVEQRQDSAKTAPRRGQRTTRRGSADANTASRRP